MIEGDTIRIMMLRKIDGHSKTNKKESRVKDVCCMI